MALATLRQVLDKAKEGNYGVGAFNVSNLEQVQAIMEAAAQTKSPVILQASRGARKYANDRFLLHLMLAASEVYPDIPIVLHQDHGDVASCKSAVDLGFTSVMMDGSLMEDHKTPSDFAYNVKVTREIVAYAHARGVSVEGELGCIGGVEDGHGVGDGDMSMFLTDPDQAVEFVAQTGVDALAVAIGTSHGAYKFAKKPDHSVLVMERIQEIHARLPQVHLVMHGSSSMPQELRDIVNKYGGALKPSWGVPVEEIQLGIKNGVRKINVDTDIRLAMTGAVRRVLAEQPEIFDPRDYLGEARIAVTKLLTKRMTDFGTAGHAHDYEVASLDAMKVAHYQR
jgi:fructose-bisphosphate aldolase class II